MAKYECTVCGYIYDEEVEGTPWDQLDSQWCCPVCEADKSNFVLVKEEPEPTPAQEPSTQNNEPGLTVCSVCGYVMEPGENHDVCPACGVPKTAFKPYNDPVSPQRRKWLNFHFHNIVVHFPQAFAVFMMFLLAATYVVEGHWQVQFIFAAKVLALFLPLSVVAGLTTGILDGKTRFKRIDTPALKLKMSIGILFLICAIAVAIVMNLLEFNGTLHLVSLILAIICSGTSVILGHTGGRLAGTVVKG